MCINDKIITLRRMTIATTRPFVPDVLDTGANPFGFFFDDRFPANFVLSACPCHHNDSSCVGCCEGWVAKSTYFRLVFCAFPFSVLLSPLLLHGFALWWMSATLQHWCAFSVSHLIILRGPSYGVGEYPRHLGPMTRSMFVLNQCWSIYIYVVYMRIYAWKVCVVEQHNDTQTSSICYKYVLDRCIVIWILHKTRDNEKPRRHCRL